MSNRPSWTISEAAQRCGVSKSTVRRYLDAERFPDAFKDPGGAWKIPLPNLLAVGWSPTDPSLSTPAASPMHAPAPAAHDRVAELEAALEVERARREAAERVAGMAERHLEDMRRALRMLERAPEPAQGVPSELPAERPVEGPAEPVAAVADAPAPPEPVRGPRRRWWQF